MADRLMDVTFYLRSGNSFTIRATNLNSTSNMLTGDLMGWKVEYPPGATHRIHRMDPAVIEAITVRDVDSDTAVVKLGPGIGSGGHRG